MSALAPTSATALTPLERAAEDLIAAHPNARHLQRARDWAVELDRGAGEALRVAALTHDVERMFPGGPVFDPMTMAPDDEAYNRAHAARSARFVAAWMRERGAAPELVAVVRELVLLHEQGGTPRADVLQAADSLSFLEVNPELLLGWLREGRAGPEQVRAKHRWMLERIRGERARSLAEPYFAAAIAQLETAVAAA